MWRIIFIKLTYYGAKNKTRECGYIPHHYFISEITKRFSALKSYFRKTRHQHIKFEERSVKSVIQSIQHDQNKLLKSCGFKRVGALQKTLEKTKKELTMA